MNIEKIKDYNQKVLAVFGSLAVVLIAILIIWTLTEYIRELSYRSYRPETEIISNEQAEINYEKSIRTHQVSFENFRLIDSLNAIYLIPVSQTALELEEYIDKRDKNSDGSLGLLNMYGGYSDFYYNNNSFNNALIYDSRDGSIQKLFEKRISINGINLENIAARNYVLFAATNKDTDSNGFLDEDDTKTLFLYSVHDQTIIEIEFENADFVSYEVVMGKDKIIIKYGLDKNNNGIYDWDEPMIMKVYNIKTNTLENLIDPELINELQNTLDGKK